MSATATSTDSAPRSRPVIVGIDGSPASIDALRRAAKIAAALEAPLEAVSVWQYPIVYAGAMTDVYFPQAVSVDQAARDMLRVAAKEVFGASPPPWYRTSIHQGNTAQVLLDASKGAEMLVVGSRGHGGFAGLLLGSVSEAVAEHASCPVLIVHNPTLSAAEVTPAVAALSAV